MPTVPSPKRTGVISMSDTDVDCTYVELPVDTLFVQAMAVDHTTGTAYLPVKRLIEGCRQETHLYAIVCNNNNNNNHTDDVKTSTTMKNGSTWNAVHLAGPLKAANGDTDLTVFGVEYHEPTGLLCLAIHNKNIVLVFDVKQQQQQQLQTVLSVDKTNNNNENGGWTCTLQIDDMYAANDICFAPDTTTAATNMQQEEDPTTTIPSKPQPLVSFYVAGGRKKYFAGKPLVDAGYGAIYKVTLHHDTAGSSSSLSYETEYVAEGFGILAGVQVLQDQRLVVSQLYDILEHELGPKDKKPSGFWKKDHVLYRRRNFTKIWKGDDPNRQDIWLSDTLETAHFLLECSNSSNSSSPDGKSIGSAPPPRRYRHPLVVTPAYRTVSKVNRNIMATKPVMSAGLFYYRFHTAHKNIGWNREGLKEACQNPEPLLSVTQTYARQDKDGNLIEVTPQPLRLIFLDLGSNGNDNNNKNNDETTVMSDNMKAYHFEVSLEMTAHLHPPTWVQNPLEPEIGGIRHYFDGQVTTVVHLLIDNKDTNGGDHASTTAANDDDDGKAGFLFCINFEQPRILVMSDKHFTEAINAKTRMASTKTTTTTGTHNETDPSMLSTLAMTSDKEPGRDSLSVSSESSSESSNNES